MAPLPESWQQISSWLWTGSCSSKCPSICHITNIQHVQLETLTACRCQSSCYFKRFCAPPPPGTSPRVSRWWELRLLLTHTESPSVQCCCYLFYFFYSFPDVSPLVWWVSGGKVGWVGGVVREGKAQQQPQRFKHWYIFIKTSTLQIFFLTFFCKNGGVNQYKICMVIWETVASLHERKRKKTNKLSEK